MNKEDYCLGEKEIPGYGKVGCEEAAKWFEEDSNHWHDWVWCDEHAEGKKVEPLKAEPLIPHK